MMLYPAIHTLTDNIPNRYLLVNVVARRARQLALEEERSGESFEEKPVTMAIQEVADGTISCNAADVVIREDQ